MYRRDRWFSKKTTDRKIAICGETMFHDHEGTNRMRPRIIAAVGSAAIAAAGLVAAFALTPAANAWNPDDLARLGYSTDVTRLADGCHLWKASGYGASADLGNDCDAGFQARLDAFINTTCPCVLGTTTAATTAPGATTTAPPTTTAAGPPPPPNPPITTVVTSDTATVTVTIASTDDLAALKAELQAQIDALKQKYDALDARVVALEKAGQVTVYGYPDGYGPAGVEYQPNPLAA